MVSMGIETGQEEVMQEQIIAVQKMQEYIEEHLQEEITLADLAGVSLFSPWHSPWDFRVWKATRGHSKRNLGAIRRNMHAIRCLSISLFLTA